MKTCSNFPTKFIATQMNEDVIFFFGTTSIFILLSFHSSQPYDMISYSMDGGKLTYRLATYKITTTLDHHWSEIWITITAPKASKHDASQKGTNTKRTIIENNNFKTAQKNTLKNKVDWIFDIHWDIFISGLVWDTNHSPRHCKGQGWLCFSWSYWVFQFSQFIFHSS